MSPTSPNPRARSTGFTLVELLVVVAIIALLIAILVPSLSKAQERANLAVCMSNLRQLGMAGFMYQNSNQGHFPYAGAESHRPEDWIYWQAGQDLNQGALVPYAGGYFLAKVYICPSDPMTRITRGYKPYQFSYTANVNVFGTPAANSPPSIPFSKFQTPSSKIMLVEEDSKSIDDSCWFPQGWSPSSGINIIALRHDKLQEDNLDKTIGKGAVNFADGHSDLLSRLDAMNTNGHYYLPLVP